MDQRTEAPKTHSQYGEDLRALALLEKWGHKTGRVLEIGAWNPITLSNSRLMIEVGWEAVLVEPSPKPLMDLAREYSGLGDECSAYADQVELICAAVTVHGGWIKLNLTEDALSGESIPAQWAEKGGFYGSAWFYSITMADLVARVGGNFQLVSIDTEGTSVEVFAAMLETGMRPRVVILEHDNRLVEMYPMAEAAAYRVSWMNGTNVMLEWTGAKD